MRYPKDVRWTGVLQKLLGEQYAVIEEGCNGRTTVFEDIAEPWKAGLGYLKPCLNTHKPIDFVIMMLGSNDLKRMFHASAKEIADGAEQLVSIIKEFTKDEFSHVSIALDKELNRMYSFGRLNPYNAFYGGFVHEYINEGTFKRFYKTRAKIYSLEISDEQYEEISKNIIKFEQSKDKYKFNTVGLFAVGIHKRIQKENRFYCAEFVKYILEKSGIKTKLPEIIKPEDFKKLDGLKEVYGGLLRQYQLPKIDIKEILRNNLVAYRKKEGII